MKKINFYRKFVLRFVNSKKKKVLFNILNTFILNVFLYIHTYIFTFLYACTRTSVLSRKKDMDLEDICKLTL